VSIYIKKKLKINLIIFKVYRRLEKHWNLSIIVKESVMIFEVIIII